MKSIFETDAYNEILERLEAVQGNATPQWGKMNVAQMLSHCQEPLKLAMGKSTLKRPGFLTRMLFKSFKSSLYNDKPWKQNLPTAKEYRVLDEKNFSAEKETLRSLIEEFYGKKDSSTWPVHPLWGNFTPQQWGQAQYKHLDHHFRQFKV